MAGYAYSRSLSHIILTLPLAHHSHPASETSQVAHPVYTLVQVILIGKVPI